MSNFDNFKNLLDGASDFLSEYNLLLEDNVQLRKQLNVAATNNYRFMNILEKIANAAGFQWYDGDFPLDQVLNQISK